MNNRHPANKYKYKPGVPNSPVESTLSNRVKFLNPKIQGENQNSKESENQIYSIIAAPATAANRPPDTRFTTPALVVGTEAAEVLEALVLVALVLVASVVVETAELELALVLVVLVAVVMVVGVVEVDLEVVVWVLVVVEVLVEVEVLVVDEAVVDATTAPETVKRGEKL